MQPFMEWQFNALTGLWTGDANQRGKRLIPTGLMGSIRWWFEVLVRGLGGSACDPTLDGVRCPDKEGRHCVACELFGCTGWARKFRLMVLDENGNVIQESIKKGHTFVLRFVPMRPIAPKEWCLIDTTLRLIACYGAIGGKTVLKPSEEWGIADLGTDDLEEHNGQVIVQHSRKGLPLQKSDVILEVEGSQISTLADLKSLVIGKPHGAPINVKIQRNGREQLIEIWAGKRHHQDLGLIQHTRIPHDLPSCTCERLERYVRDERWRKNIPSQYQEDKHQQYDYSWASLKNFWCVEGRYLARHDHNTSSFNFVIERREPKGQSTQGDSWLAGRRPDRQKDIEAESKKVFSFKEPQEARRTFGFVQDGNFSTILDRLKVLKDGDGNGRRPDPVWRNFEPDKEFLTGKQVLEQLLRREGAV